MMAIFGFLALCAVGIYSVAAGLYFLWLCSVFGGLRNAEALIPLIPIAIGITALWVAFVNSPLSVTVQVQP
jgi:hypothetical protein